MVLNLHSFSGYSHDHGSHILQALDFLRESTSICAVDTFILISGYFGIKWKIKSFFNLSFQVFFYSFAVYFFCVAFGILVFEKRQFMQCFLGLCNSWGFIKNYVTLYFLSPLLNTFSESSDRKKLFFYIIVLFFAENFIFHSVEAINFCLLYLIGKWINKTNAVYELRLNALILYFVMTLVIFILSYSLYLIFHLDAPVMSGLVLAYSYASPFVIIQAIGLFLVFARTEIQSKLINWAAASCLSIFLIHMHPAIKHIGYYKFTDDLYNKPVLEHLALLVFLIFIVFCGSIIIDKIRIYVSNKIYNLLGLIANTYYGKNSFYSLIDQRFFKLYNHFNG